MSETEDVRAREVTALPPTADAVLGRVFRAHYSGLVAMARLLIDRPEEAEEIVQEAFCRAYAGWSRLRDPDDPLPYLRTSVVNLCRSGLRRRRTVRAQPAPVEAFSPGADERALLTVHQKSIVAALTSLPQKQRECVALRYLLECSTAETAAALGISEGTVKSHLSRALRNLEAALEAIR